MRLRLGFYRLDDDGLPVAEPDLLTWGEWFETADRAVAHDEFFVGGQQVLVSTIFLGLDHNYTDRGDPVLWETMIFGGEHDQWCRRYETRAEAATGHALACGLAKGDAEPWRIR